MSVDIIKYGNKYKVLEMNSGIMMKQFSEQSAEFFSKTYEIYQKALLYMFNIKNEKWCVYLIKNKNCTYVGATPDSEKRIKKHKKFLTHISEISPKVGDVVRITATKPISKNKRWRVSEILQESNNLG